LSLAFYKCATGTWQHLPALPFQQENFKLSIQDAHFDLKTGNVEVNSDSNEVAENLSLAFSVALLHVLCQPRYTPPPPPEPIPVTVEPPPAEPEKPVEPEKPAEEKPAEEKPAEAEKPKDEEAEKPAETAEAQETTEATEAGM